MTNERVGSFVSDLVEMAKAVEQVPVLESEIRGFQFEVKKLLEESAKRQSDLDQARTYAASLEQRCHDLEVQRDAAELRFLESDDAVGTLKRAMRIAMGEVDSALQAVEPPKPEPKADEWAELMANPLSEPVDFPLVDGPLAPQGEVSEVPVDPTQSGEHVASQDLSASVNPASATSFVQVPDWIIEPDGLPQGVSVPPSPTASPSPMPSSPNALPVEPSASAASDNDLEPTKYDYYGSVRQSWREWYSRQHQQDTST